MESIFLEGESRGREKSFFWEMVFFLGLLKEIRGGVLDRRNEGYIFVFYLEKVFFRV